jgi:hypothetical protein
LNAIATPAALEPGPLVTRVRSRTVANVASIGFVVRRAAGRPCQLDRKRVPPDDPNRAGHLL